MRCDNNAGLGRFPSRVMDADVAWPEVLHTVWLATISVLSAYDLTCCSGYGLMCR